MTVIISQIGRIQVRRSAQRYQQSIASRTKCQKASPDGKRMSGAEEDGANKSIPTPNTITPPPLWQRLGPLSDLLNAYGRGQKRRPYVTQICTSLAIYLCGDLSAQKIDGEPYDARRTTRNLIIGGISSIPAYNWFMYLGRSFNYPSKLLSLSTKVVVNQIVFTPIFNSYFFGMQSLLSGDGLAEAWERIQRTVPVSVINSFKLWPAVTAFNFTYIEPQYRAIFAGLVAIGWQSYLSWLNQRAAREEMARKGMIRQLDAAGDTGTSS